MAISDKLNKLVLIKSNIKQALISKGCNPSNDFDTYANEINNIKTGEGFGLITKQKEECKEFLHYTYDADEYEALLNYINNFYILGAFLSFDGESYYIWNTNPDDPNYWNPKSYTISSPSSKYGKIIGVCVGKGLWASVPWCNIEYDDGCAYVECSSFIWSHKDSFANISLATNVHHNGLDNTNHIMNNYFNIYDFNPDSIWYTIYNFNKKYSNNSYYGSKVYIPSILELLECINNICDDFHVGGSIAGDNTNSSKSHSFNTNLAHLLHLNVIPNYVSFGSSTQEADSRGEFNTLYALGTNLVSSLSKLYDEVAYLAFVTLEADEHDVVSLGLPSGNRWAKCNIGANSPEEKGLLFTWGDTRGFTKEQIEYEEKAELIKNPYCKYEEHTWKITKYNYYTNYGNINRISRLLDEDNAAKIYKGKKFDIPTKEDFEELLNPQYTTISIVDDNCIKITSNRNGRYIIIPNCKLYSKDLAIDTNSSGSYDNSNKAYTYLASKALASLQIYSIVRSDFCNIRPIYKA